MGVKSDVARLEKVTRALGEAKACCQCPFDHDAAVAELCGGEPFPAVCPKCGKPRGVLVVQEEVTE